MKPRFVFLFIVTPIVFGFTSFKNIPKCYLSFEGIDNYILADFERKPFTISTSREFKITKDKTVTINLVDTYKAYFQNSDSETNLTIEIELSENKKFKDYILAHYQLISEHHQKDHNESLVLENFKIDTVDVYGFTSKSIANPNLGNYALFPTDKMAIYFRFMSPQNTTIKSIEDFIIARDSLIHYYLTHVSKCNKK